MTSPAVLDVADGTTVVLPLQRWLGEAGLEERRVLARAIPPVLDVGCGPGRHVLALCRMGRIALGVDAAPAAVLLAHQRGAPVLERSIFARVPGRGRWASALVLDANIGIGGDPVLLLQRVGELLRPGGLVLVEVEPPGAPSGPCRARLRAKATTGPWFPWARVGADEVADVFGRARFEEAETWCDGGRWFACGLRR